MVQDVEGNGKLSETLEIHGGVYSVQKVSSKKVASKSSSASVL